MHNIFGKNILSRASLTKLKNNGNPGGWGSKVKVPSVGRGNGYFLELHILLHTYLSFTIVEYMNFYSAFSQGSKSSLTIKLSIMNQIKNDNKNFEISNK